MRHEEEQLLTLAAQCLTAVEKAAFILRHGDADQRAQAASVAESLIPGYQADIARIRARFQAGPHHGDR